MFQLSPWDVDILRVAIFNSAVCMPARLQAALASAACQHIMQASACCRKTITCQHIMQTVLVQQYSLRPLAARLVQAKSSPGAAGLHADRADGGTAVCFLAVLPTVAGSRCPHSRRVSCRSWSLMPPTSPASCSTCWCCRSPAHTT